MAAILAAILGKKVDEKRHLITKILYAKFGLERANGLGVGGHTHRQTRLKACLPSAPLDPLQVVNYCVGKTLLG